MRCGTGCPVRADPVCGRQGGSSVLPWQSSSCTRGLSSQRALQSEAGGRPAVLCVQGVGGSHPQRRRRWHAAQALPLLCPSFPLPRSLPPLTTKARPQQQCFHGQALELCDPFLLRTGGSVTTGGGRNTGFSQCVWNQLQHSITNQN